MAFPQRLGRTHPQASRTVGRSILNKAMIKEYLGRGVLIALSVVVALVLAEALYRGSLWLETRPIREAETNPPLPREVRFAATPGLWVFNREYGFDYRPEGMRFGRIVEGKFSECGTMKMNSRGNIARFDTDFNAAEVRIALIGSSYTMVEGTDGRRFHELVEEQVGQALGKRVLVENFGRDSFGVAAMMDMAPAIARDYRPDLIVIAFNTATLAMNRHWRVVKGDDDGNGFANFYMVNGPENERLSSRNARIHEYVMTDRITEEWCDRMAAAVARGDDKARAEDPLVRDILDRFKAMERRRNSLRFVGDLKSLRVSYLYNRIKRGNAFAGIEAYRKDVPLVPYPFNSFAEDPRFVASHKALEASGAAYAIIHVPAYPEVKKNDEWATLDTLGIGLDRAKSLKNSISTTTNKPIRSILPYIATSGLAAEPLAMKALPPDQDWHPSPAGADLFSRAISELIVGELQKTLTKKASR
jgi:hypothetical protein